MMTLTPGPRMWSFSFLFCALLLSPISWSLNVTYVSPEEKKQLELDFLRAQSEIPQELEGSWTCDLIGVRSGLLKEKSIVLYDLKRIDSNTIENNGASPSPQFSSSKMQRPEITSRGPKVIETLRFLSKSELIGTLKATKTEENVAYSRCIKTPKTLTKSSQTNDTIASHD